MAAMDTLMPGIRTGNFAPCRAGGFAGTLDPLFIHSGEVCFLKKDDSDTRDPFEGSACDFEDGRHILQALSGLLLDRIPNNLPGYWIVGPRA
jgi:hypothetical protein